ncbi:MAG: ABC transporter ATP-binding protein/permease [Clostridia bacterium]|nr:ABC transporter ATP-binding protein/permease [Clostridia bacterium]
MLQLKNIVKQYRTGDEVVDALRGVNIDFRQSEFVSVLGPSGCGKTTLLNIIGGLDQYTDGDLIIDGKSTKEFNDRDWDTYRNHKVGFVFQSYNLIGHQTVLANVELALTLSGVSKAERRERAKEALRKVGLENQINKKPNQMSGGQMQRVAIARALVNDPEILLADEPMGALDSATSVQIMDLLKEIAKDRLVIMVTHNPELAEKYSTRIVRFLDGVMTSDTAPFKYEPEKETEEKKEAKTKKAKGEKKTSMSFLTALSLSLNNLMTKKARTFLTSFAGSIGIIGIALILSISNGLQLYIDRVQEDTLSSYPITIQKESMDMSALIESLMSATGESGTPVNKHELDKIYANVIFYDMMNSLINAEIIENNLKDFKTFLDNNLSNEAISSVIYGYDMELNIYSSDLSSIRKLNPSDFINSLTGGAGASSSSSMISMGSFKIWEEMMAGKEGEYVNGLIKEQYDLVEGSWPTKYNELVIVVDKNNEISDLVLCMLGFKSEEDMNEIINAAMKGEELPADQDSWTYEEVLSTTFKLVIPSDYYYKNSAGVWEDRSEDETYMKTVLSGAEELKIVGIIRPNEDAVAQSISGTIGYTYALTEHIEKKINESKIVIEQKANPDVDVFTGLPFKGDDFTEPTAAEKAQAVRDYVATLSEAEKAVLYSAIMTEMPKAQLDAAVEAQMAQFPTREAQTEMLKQIFAAQNIPAEKAEAYLREKSDEEVANALSEMIAMQAKEQYTAYVKQQLASLTVPQLAAALDAHIGRSTDEALAVIYDEHLPSLYSDSTYEKNERILSVFDIDEPSTISIYAATFEAKDEIAALIEKYNASVEDDDKITYTDYIKIMMSSITTIINAISYILIAFVSISLIVSSIMIGIITYISVLERTKEIGVLRAIGASKKDVGRVFNAETLIVGFTSGMIGILVTVILNIPINLIIKAITDIGGIATLPWQGAVILVLISMGLTLIAGLFPSKIAAKKDPVVALRTE